MRMLDRTRAGLVILIFLWCSGISEIHGIRWLSLLRTASIGSFNRADLCDSLEGLTKKQVKICKRNVEVMNYVRSGAERAITECQYQFSTRRWNCSTVNSTKVFGKALNEGTREAAFVHAISAAGVAHDVTRACSNGQLDRCGCDRTVNGFSSYGFKWAGCSDNVAFGTAFSKSFVDARDLRTAKGRFNSRALMNLHNNEAGRKVIEYNMKIECKCHGISGSCEMKTCWRALPSFREVGQILKEKFDGATEVQLRKIGKRQLLVPQNKGIKHYTETDLVYLDSSPDFCVKDEKIGSFGTHGRTCNRTSRAIDGCELLCCGRGYISRTETVVERCMCKFYWCCFVKCRDCKREVEVNTCL